MSDDGRHGLTIIAFIGSVFSPYYAWARARGNGDPLDHCSINVAIYGEAGKRWCMTERRQASLSRTRETLAIGPSSLEWTDETLTISFDERTVPFPSRLHGTVRLELPRHPGGIFFLDPSQRHQWSPLAPVTRCKVDLASPSLRWEGNAYFDRNCGSEPLENAFSTWQWSRAHVNDRAVILYDVERKGADALALSLSIDRENRAEEIELPRRASLPRTRWGIERSIRSGNGQASVRSTLESAPFYARSIVETELFGKSSVSMHESLSLERFQKNWVRLMLPFRMPRRVF